MAPRYTHRWRESTEKASVPAVVLDGHPRPERGFAEPAQADHPHHALAVPFPVYKQRQHARVIRAPAGQRSAHVGREVLVAHGDGVRAAGGPLPHPRGRGMDRRGSGAAS